jgi:crossover junction endodeoxyribonuclease RuvC
VGASFGDAPTGPSADVPDPSRLDELTARAQRVIAGQAGKAVGTPSAGVDQPPAPATPPAGAIVLVGIDPGTATTGYGFVRVASAAGDTCQSIAFGVIQTPAGQPMPERLLTLQRELRHLIALHRPVEAAVEKLFFGRNATTAIGVGQARGVVLAALAEAGLPVAEYTPAEVKQAMAGFGRAQKSQIQRMTQALLQLDTLPTPDDAADALAVALCHARMRQRRAAGLA